MLTRLFSPHLEQYDHLVCILQCKVVSQQFPLSLVLHHQAVQIILSTWSYPTTRRLLSFSSSTIFLNMATGFLLKSPLHKLLPSQVYNLIDRGSSYLPSCRSHLIGVLTQHPQSLLRGSQSKSICEIAASSDLSFYVAISATQLNFFDISQGNNVYND